MENKLFSKQKKNDKNARKIFKALVTCCLDENQYALCTYCPNSRSKLAYGLLCPYIQNESETIGSNKKFGFYLKKLPFKGEFKSNLLKSDDSNISDKKTLAKKAKNSDLENEIMNLIKNSTSNAQPNVSNAHLQKMQAVIEAVALDREDLREVHNSMSNFVLCFRINFFLK